MSDPRWIVEKAFGTSSDVLLWPCDPMYPNRYQLYAEDLTFSHTSEAQPAYDALVAAVRDAARVPQLEAEIERLREGLDYIAEPDTLLNANEEAFNEHAARRMQRQARHLLSPPAPTTPTPGHG